MTKKTPNPIPKTGPPPPPPPKKLVECGTCHKQFKRNDHLKNHVEAIHELIKYPCHICGTKVSRKDKLKRHIKTVHPALAAANNCGDNFMVGHREQKPMAKPRSKSKASQQPPCCVPFYNHDLTIQKTPIRTTPHKMVECSTCHKQFKRNDHLKNHVEAIHHQIKYPCHICGTKVSRKDKLKRHIRTVHPALAATNNNLNCGDNLYFIGQREPQH